MTDQGERNWADEFPILRELAFFNHAGVAPISARAEAALREYAEQAAARAYVKSGWYARAHKVKHMAARLINAAGPDEIAFVANTSSGISLVAKGLDWQRGDNVIITNVEYPANRYPWIDLERFGVEVIEAPQERDGRVDLDRVLDAVTNRTRVVAISHVQYASGYRIDLRPISDMVHRVGGYLCVDAIQSLGAMPVDVAALGIDFLAADGHKWLLSPEGAGLFYCRGELATRLHPNVVGWMNMLDAQNYGDYRFEFQPDARRFEPGSYNIPGVLALGATLELLLEIGADEIWRRLEALTARLCEGLREKGYRIFSPRGEGERSGIVIFDPPESRDTGRIPDPTQIVADLEQQGIIIVMREGRLRASPHFYNTAGQIERLIEALP
ncbi:MAG: aminotransferase class V-fold PLP-dependent enzyme [Phycisphaeraceae bacterium]